jgi:hypothetical protein
MTAFSAFSQSLDSYIAIQVKKGTRVRERSCGAKLWGHHSSEKRYLRAMAEPGADPRRSDDISEQLKQKVTALGSTRNQLISKGMIWSPNHGDTAFTVPLFDEFMCRILPGDDWKQ